MKPILERRRFNMVRIRIIIATVLALSALGGGTVYAAQDSLPGDALYSVKLGTETVTMMVGEDDVARAQRALNFADKRVREMIALTEGGHPENLNLTVEKYCYALNMSMTRMETALGKGKSQAGDIATLVAEATAQHLSVLNGLHDTVPDAAKPAIQRAMEEAQKCYQRAIQVREELGLQVFGLATIPATMQERVEQWIQESAEAGLAEVGQ
jgi:hypothetical protein